MEQEGTSGTQVVHVLFVRCLRFWCEIGRAGGDTHSHTQLSN